MEHAVFDAVRALLAGEEIDVDSPELSARSAWLSEPRPVQEQIPLTIGTANSVLLRWAGAHADVVGIAGFGRTLPDGHMHEVRWRAHELEQQLGHVAAGAAGRTDSPPLEALVQQVVVTHDARAAIAATASRLGLTEAELLAAPFVLAGTADEIVSAVAEHERRWGVTRYVIRETAIDAVAPLLPRTARNLRPSSAHRRWT
jgi:alkanesulfonate monooxygenase SsuD/methylene tetrahydromethanopterin reductase-like flavin-dependent oxidoreductase (luciferase family)